MINKDFEVYKLKREIRRSGEIYSFFRNKENEFGETNLELSLVGTVTGLYHEQNSSIQIAAGDTTRFRTEKIPMILCTWENYIKSGTKVDDIVIINNIKNKVTGIINVQEWNKVADISLERIDNGSY